ncbi:glycosyltransferase, MGT family [Filimonas lacunae]|uniref:Glycosyltransferase, MGT family n=1 Tax=Filimonas lacunae TaxID=477680 RepID=A0A173MMH6_9BACT|nr:glycosyltransferase [Filimonas lacunae]BAV08669.1 macrolide glycosyltransferase [Filimonas lacunae]SIS59665.1 glycosyltransferase, MGT family [Filimonas lacunae]
MQTKKILIVTIPEKGHINPMIGIAQHLQQAGFELAFFAQVDISDQLQAAGLHQQVFYDTTVVNVSEGFITKGKAFVEQLADIAWLRNWIKTLLIDAVPAQVQRIQQAVDAFEPDIIVTDPMVYAAAIVANRAGIPWAGVSSSLNPVTPDGWQCELTDTLDDLDYLRQELMTTPDWQPQFKVSDVISPWLNIVFTVEEYVSRRFSRNDFSFYVGNSFPAGKRGDEADFPFEKLLPGTQKIYMSMGSQIYYHPQLFRAVAEALYDEDIQLIFSINELYYTDFVNSLPDNVIAVPYAPQLQVLQHVQLLITHGGANSVMEGLANGVPVAVLPICNDQFLQAKFIEHAGVGVVLDPAQPSPSVYRQQLLPLLHNGAAEKERARLAGEAFRQKGGAAEAAQLIIQLYNTRKPLTPCD